MKSKKIKLIPGLPTLKYTPDHLHDAELIGVTVWPKYCMDKETQISLRFRVVDDQYFKQYGEDPLIEIHYWSHAAIKVRGEFTKVLASYKNKSKRLKRVNNSSIRKSDKNVIHRMSFWTHNQPDHVIVIECNRMMASLL